MIIKMGNKIKLNKIPAGGGASELKPLTSMHYLRDMLNQLRTVTEYDGSANMILIHKKIASYD